MKIAARSDNFLYVVLKSYMARSRDVVAFMMLSCACSPPQPGAESGATITLGSSGSESDESESGAPIDMDTSPETCSSEWDCGVGERCEDASCVCVGCACSQGAASPGTIDRFEEQTVPVELGQEPEPECGDDTDCEPLEYCDGWQCVETTGCIDDLDCYEDWPNEPRFCVDGVCKPIPCVDDLDCPDTALCEDECQWIDVVPDCVSPPAFDELIADTLVSPDAAAVVSLDLDLDGRDDLAVLDDGALHWLISTGASFAAPTAWAGDPGTQPVSLARADIHGDGVDELLAGHVGMFGVEILVVSEAGPQLAEFVATAGAPNQPTAIDVDYDGLPDLVAGTTVEGLTTTIEAQLGDGTGTFASLWMQDVEPFESIGPLPAFDWDVVCERALAAGETDYLGARPLDHEGVESGSAIIFDRPTVGERILDETPSHAAGILATLQLDDRGVLYVYEAGTPYQLVDLSPAPDDVVLVSPDGQTHYAIIDHGAEPAEYVEFTGSPLTPVCRGSLGFPLDVEQLGAGDFDGDGREDVFGRGADGVVRVWYSRE